MKVKTRLEPPDGGWGILVCLGMVISFTGPLAALPCFVLIFGDFLKNLGAGTSAISLITSAFFCSYSLSGLFSGSLFNRFGLRTVGLFGGFSYFFGCVMQIFVNSVVTLALAFSLIQGIGFGLIVPCVYTTFNNYFVKNRVMWMSLAKTLIGLGCMLYPVLMEKLLATYGFRGCLMVLAAINSHAVLGMLLMQPVEWHMRKVVIEDDEKKGNPICLGLKEAAGKKLALEEKICHEDDLYHLSPLIYSRKNSGKFSSDLQEKISSVPYEEEKRSIFQIIVDFLDLTLLKQPIYVNIVLGISFALYSDITFFTLQPLYMFELGFNKADTASVIAIGAGADLASRICLIFSSALLQMPSRHIYLAGAFFTIIARFAFLNAFDFKSMAIITAVMGFLRTWVHVPIQIIFAEYLPKERFACGYGLFMFLEGNIIFALGPVIGYIYDKTQDYIITFHCLTFFMALCAFLWILEIILVKFTRHAKLSTSVNI